MLLEKSPGGVGRNCVYPWYIFVIFMYKMRYQITKTGHGEHFHGVIVLFPSVHCLTLIFRAVENVPGCFGSCDLLLHGGMSSCV